jgi:hypothetical protein
MLPSLIFWVLNQHQHNLTTAQPPASSLKENCKTASLLITFWKWPSAELGITMRSLPMPSWPELILEFGVKNIFDYNILNLFLGSGQNSNIGLRRFMPDFASLYNNSPQGIFQDMIEDLMRSDEGRPRNPSVGGSGSGIGAGNGIFGNFLSLEQLI